MDEQASHGQKSRPSKVSDILASAELDSIIQKEHERILKGTSKSSFDTSTFGMHNTGPINHNPQGGDLHNHNLAHSQLTRSPRKIKEMEEEEEEDEVGDTELIAQEMKY